MTNLGDLRRNDVLIVPTALRFQIKNSQGECDPEMPVPEHRAQPLPEAEHQVGTGELCPQVPRVDGGGLQSQKQSSKRRSVAGLRFYAAG